MEVIPCLLPMFDSQVAFLVTVVHAESNNGYDLLWQVMELLVLGFDLTMQISAPVSVWMGEGIFHFCLSYVLYFCLQVKKGLLHDNHTKRITFLQAVHDPAYIDVVTTLQAHINTFQSEDFGYLRPTLCMMGLAAQMNKNARARVRGIVPCARCMECHTNDRTAMTSWIQGFHLPQVFWTDFSRDRSQHEAWTQGRPVDGRTTPSCQMNGFVHHGRDSLPRHDRTDTRDDCKSSHGRYAWPDHICWAWDPDIVCEVCKWQGHSATNCDMLAMALFLEKYVKVLMTPTTRDRIEAAWLQRWKETLGNPRHLPHKVQKGYLDSLDILADMLNGQMDWECWPKNDALEDFGQDQGDEVSDDL
jgi:hypothetical protein